MLIPTIALACAALSLGHAVAAAGPKPGQIKNLVTFGDSYTDIRVGHAGDNGTAWPVYAAAYGHLTLHPYARAGATCANALVPRPFASVAEAQVPRYLRDVRRGAGAPDMGATVHTLWVGTNDVGANGLLTGEGARGVTVVDTARCAVEWVKTLYEAGARNFLLQNMIPLQRTILFGRDSYPNGYWTLQKNATAWSLGITELVNAANALWAAWLELLAPTLPGAHIGLFDSYQFFNDMLADPGAYLNGTVAPNITGAIHTCVFRVNESDTGPSNCTTVTGPAMDSYFWYDELHPSEQTDRNIAKVIAAVVNGTSTTYTTWFS